MSKKNFVTLFSLLFAFFLFLSVSSVNAATFEQLKEDVRNDTGVVYNPELARDMTKEEALSYVSVVEIELLKKHSSLVTEEIQDRAYKYVAFGSSSAEKMSEKDFPILPQGTSIPTSSYTLNGAIYTSEGFSGSGMRYSGYCFVYGDYSSHPQFGVRANKAAFTFITRRGTTQVGSYSVSKDDGFHFYPSTNSGNLNGYLSISNPPTGCNYDIR